MIRPRQRSGNSSPRKKSSSKSKEREQKGNCENTAIKKFFQFYNSVESEDQNLSPESAPDVFSKKVFINDHKNCQAFFNSKVPVQKCLNPPKDDQGFLMKSNTQPISILRQKCKINDSNLMLSFK